MYLFDPLYLIVMVVGLGLSLWATGKVKSAFAKYRRVESASGLTGQEVAEMILRRSGVDAHVGPTDGRRHLFGASDGGDLTDHYDPRTREVKLSPQVYNSSSIAAQAIAAHEVGHAIQHANGYAPLAIRNTIAPAAALGSNFSYFLILIGIFMSAFSLVKLGILFFAVAVAFQLITLPVEFDASRRAKKILQEMNIVSAGEGKGVAAVLDAAALTYVAAAATALLNLVYLLLRFRD